jgi:predicted ATPase/class 3 adenylate cyclase
MADLPSGTVTFLFTDIEGSTALWERDRAAMATAVERHHTLLRTAAETHHGVLFKIVGDAVQAAFPTAPDAVAAALDAQRTLMQETWPQGVGALRVRMALHTAAATPEDGDYLAPGLNRLSRLLAAGHGGQTILSLATQDLARDALPPGAALRDLGEHPLRDLYRPERVFQLLHPDLPADFPSIRTLATRPNNLPLQPTSFLGREDQVARVVDLLRRDDVRLLTITGSGGVGKTRLALQAAADVLEDFPDGVWFVDLSVLDDPALVLSTIAAVLGVREEGSTLMERLAGVLSEKRLLVVLDNFERVVEATQIISDLLAHVSGLKVLATSRTPLHAYGEREYPLAPLPLPDPAHLPSVAELSQYEAVRLFIERAQAVKPDFVVTRANAPAVAEICYRLDGLPLAIELAAALVKMLPPQALLKRLEQRLPLLTGGARTLPARQQTMRNAIAWGHDLLTPDEQLLFRRLAVFPGGCTIEAAEAVANPDGGLEVFAGLASLVDKSLLRQEEGAEGEPRFKMLETVREYGLEQLAACGEGEETRRRQAAWCLALAELAAPELLGRPMKVEWLVRLEDEYPNLRAAVLWFLETDNAADALRFLTVTEDFWGQNYHYAEISTWVSAALAAAPDAPPIDRFVAYHVLTYNNAMIGKHQDAFVHAQLALAAARESGDLSAMGLAQYDVGMAAEHSGDGARAAAAYAEAVPLLREAGNTAVAAWALADLGDKLVWVGDLEKAVPMLDEAISLLRQGEYFWGVAMALGQRGYAALAQKDLPSAAQFFSESIEAAREIAEERAALGAVVGLAGVALTLKQPQRAARVLGAAQAAREGVGIGRQAHALHAERIEVDVLAALGKAAFDRAWSDGRTLTLEETIAEGLALADEVTAAQEADPLLPTILR